MKINKESFKELALSLHFQLNDNQLQKLYEESEQLLTALENLDNLDVSNITPMHYPISHSFSSLREDESIKNHDAHNYLKNAKNHHGKYIVVK
jgi:aspartyl/glutamyl-tRNA(Asn/Gln) amidotransferase C subunit